MFKSTTIQVVQVLNIFLVIIEACEFHMIIAFIPFFNVFRLCSVVSIVKDNLRKSRQYRGGVQSAINGKITTNFEKELVSTG